MIFCDELEVLRNFPGGGGGIPISVIIRTVMYKSR